MSDKRENKNSQAKIQASNRYLARKYDRISFVVPKGQKEIVQAAADRAGESINEYVNKAILARMGLDRWPD